MTKIIIGVLLIVIGLSALTGLALTKFVIALIFIFFGIRLIVRQGGHSGDACCAATSNEDFINEVVIFGPLNKV
ncbi:MAG: hypothetical protein PHQ47_03635, partial [Candidatus Portnoybacteria bacterium]|nr:hypothetical protein [Candidatus Portnoybacteria bacterium]